ncbi:EAL domain-containing protein [Rhodospira trueperi]|nr:EAL domain-containing protein [Rhodospira trueperi]
MSRSSAGREALFVGLSRLRPINRTPTRLRIAAQLFAPLVSGYGCEVFSLSSGDLVIMGNGMPPGTLELQGERLRALFRSDPGSRGTALDGRDLFLTIYDLTTDNRALENRIRLLAEDRDTLTGPMNPSSPPPDRPMEPGLLRQISGALQKLDPRPLMQRQVVLRIDEERHGAFHYEEFFVSMAEVRRACARGIDVTASRWLFQEICRQLDQRAIAAMTRLPLPEQPVGVGLNLSVDTVLSPAMKAFTGVLPEGTTLTVEVQVIDAFSTLDRLGEANRWLRDRGHRLVLDGVTPRALSMIDPARLDVGGLKLMWDPDLDDPAAIWDGPHPKAMIEMMGADRIVLSRVETDQALTWGLTAGIHAFQGFFVDRVIGATTMAGCPQRKACTLMQCVERRRSAAGPTRRTCPNPPQLDAITRLHKFGEGVSPGVTPGARAPS